MSNLISIVTHRSQTVAHFFRRLEPGYKNIFSIEEIESKPILQWMFGAMLFYFFVSFFRWIGDDSTTVEAVKQGTAICWPYFQDCTHLYFLHGFPYGYSQSTLYMAFYGIMCLIVYCMWRKEWSLAHSLMLILLAWKVFVIFLLSFVMPGPYDYYHVILTSILLFVPFKEYFLKLSFVWMYFMSVTVKFTPAWELGTYFSSMKSGLPIFPAWSTLLLTNFVIFVQIVDSWFLMSRNRILQRISFVIAVVFHLYSGTLVFYNYPSVALPPVLILFGPMYSHTPTPFSRRAIAGWLIIVVVGLFQLLGFVVSPDRFLTLEGHRYGMFMFESNHQCQVTFTTHSTNKVQASEWNGVDCNGLFCATAISVKNVDGETIRTRKMESASAWNRCDPYELWFRAKSGCSRSGVQRIAMQFDHSVNGGPFYRMINEPDICTLTYKPFSHNNWIKIPPEAEAVGHPVENFYSRF